MTSRLQDVLPVTVGLYLVALGAIFAIDSFGIVAIGAAGLIEAAVGLALIALGILAILAWIRVRRFSRRLQRAFGHVHSGDDWTVDDGVIRTALGDIHLNLEDAGLPEGDTELTLLCWVGAVHVRVPQDVDLDVTAQTFVGSVEVLGIREEGFLRDIHVRSTDARPPAPRRLQLHLSTAIGEILVVQPGAHPAERIPG
jgi:hypothetical protein